MSRHRFAALLLISLLVPCACFVSQQAQEVALQLRISHVAGNEPLRLGHAHYTTQAGESFEITALRYYIGAIRLRRADGSWVSAVSRQPDAGFHLVDVSDAASVAFDAGSLPAARYAGIEFLLGVDEARNDGGAQTGALDPAKGMFWTWNTGYIFFKLEGRSPQSTLDAQAFSYHLGGGEHSAARKVFLPLEAAAGTFEAGPLAQLHLKFDVARVFDGVRISQLPSAMSAAQWQPLADNAAGAFSVDRTQVR